MSLSVGKLDSTTVDIQKAEELPQLRPTSILHRTPWRPPTAVSAKGIYITLENGQKVIDAAGGAAVTCLGHGHPTIVKAVQEQVASMAYVYNMQLSNKHAEDLAEYLVKSGKGAFELCLFVSGGSEAMEAVIKLARQYYWETQQPRRKNFIARKLSFHGNTVATLSLAFHPGRRAPYEAMLNHDDFHHVSPAYAARLRTKDESEEEYVERLRKELEDKFLELGPDTVVGFVAETVVGATTGCVPPPKGYFKAMKSVCDKYGALFILDEVMSGMGRMGTLHAWETYGDGVTPDIQAVAKGLGAGYTSIGAVLMNKRVADGIRDNSGYLMHGHTYQANPLACATSLAVQQEIESKNLLANCRAQGAHMESLLRFRLLSPNSPAAPFVHDIRGGGLFWGVDYDMERASPGAQYDFKGKHFGLLVQARCLENGLIIMGFHGGANLEGTKGDHTILSPAYNITQSDVELMVDIYVKSVEDTLREFIV